MRFRRVARVAALISAMGIAPLHAEDVTLTSRDGQIALSGTLLGYDGEFYRLETVYGELTVDGSGVLCEGPGCPNLDPFVAKVSVSGSASMGGLLFPALLEAFAQRNGYLFEQVEIDASHRLITLTDTETDQLSAEFRVRLSTTSEGFADLLADEADMVLALREIRPEEQRRAEEAGMGDMTRNNRSRVLALDALVPIVAPGNPIREIAPEDLASVFAGDIVNWQALGGPDAPISLHAPDASSGLAQAMDDLLMVPANMFVADAVVRHGTAQSLSQAVAADPFALGLGSLADVGNGQALVLRGACGRSLRATRRTVKTEDYPLTAPMFLYLPMRRLPKAAREFVSFMRQPVAQLVVRRAGFVDQATEEVPVELQGDRLSNAILSAGQEIDLALLQSMMETLAPLRRLSLSFRFDAGAVRLDPQSRANVIYLAQALEQGRYDGRQLLFVGFSDGDGPAASNRAIALRRAEEVRRAVIAAAETADFDQVAVEVDAFGEALPMACDDSAWGRRTNRRVEVWVR